MYGTNDWLLPLHITNITLDRAFLAKQGKKGYSTVKNPGHKNLFYKSKVSNESTRYITIMNTLLMAWNSLVATRYELNFLMLEATVVMQIQKS